MLFLGLNEEPTLKQILEQQKTYVFTPHLWVITIFFTVNLCLQFGFVLLLLASEASASETLDVVEYAFNQACIAGWTLAWLNSRFDLAAIAALIYVLLNVHTILATPPPPSTPHARAVWTAQQYAMILGFIGFLTTLAIVMELSTPTRAAKGLLSLLVYSTAVRLDWRVGASLSIHLLGIWLMQQTSSWTSELIRLILGTFVIAGVRWYLSIRSQPQHV